MNHSLLHPLPHESGSFRARDGTPLYYEVRGKGPPMVLCYGLTCKMAHWRHQVEYFSNRYSVVTLDYRGHQRAGMPKNSHHLTLQWCTRDIVDVIEHLGLRKFVLMGHSMGVPLVLQLASWMPKRVSAVVGICGTVDNPFRHMFHSDKLDLLYDAVSVFADVFPETSERVWKKLTRSSRVNLFFTNRLGFNPDRSAPEDVLGYMEGVHESKLVLFKKLLDDYQQFPGKKILERVSSPVLLIAGEKDVITPMHLSEHMAKELANAHLEKISEGSHNAHMDFPGMVNRRIEQFLNHALTV